MDHASGKELASVCGRRHAPVFLTRQGLLAPCGSTRFFTDEWGIYERPISPAQHVVGKQPTQNMASKPIHLRTRIQLLVRRSVGFSTTPPIHDLIVGLFINRYEFERPIEHGINRSGTPSSRGTYAFVLVGWRRLIPQVVEAERIAPQQSIRV